MATLAPCLAALRSEFDAIGPRRDKSSDGWIGDQAHAQRPSDHNPDQRGIVHALDVDMTGPWLDGWTMEKAVQAIVIRHRRQLDGRAQNIIFRSRIWSRSWGWTARAYTGPNPHDKHAHFSARYTAAAEADTRPWGLLTPPPYAAGEEFVMATAEDVEKAVLKALNTTIPYVTNGPGKRLQAAGWSNLSARALWEYLLEDAVSQREATAEQLHAFRTEMIGMLQAIDADPANPVQLPAETAQALADQLTERLGPGLAKAVGDDIAARMQG